MLLDFYKAIDFNLLSYQIYNEAHFADFKFQDDYPSMETKHISYF